MVCELVSASVGLEEYWMGAMPEASYTMVGPAVTCGAASCALPQRARAGVWGFARGGRFGGGQPASEGPPYFLSSLAGASGGVLGVSQAEGGGNTMIEPVAVCPGGTRAGTS